MTDVIVIGAGPNGLVAANLLAHEGLEVVVCEEQATPGGAVRSGQVTRPGFEHDLFSAFYPFAAASPVMRALELECWGLRWRRAPLVLAHPTSGGQAAILSTDLDETMDSLDGFAHGDGAAWQGLYGLWRRIEAPFMNAFTTPFPPIRAALRLAARLRFRLGLEVARIGIVPLRRFVEENFRGEGGRLLLAASAAHADLNLDSPGGAFFGWVLCSIGQRHGFPAVEGGASRLTEALVRRLEDHGGSVICNARVERVVVERGRARGVRLSDGRELRASDGILADVGAPQLYRELLDPGHLPTRVLNDLDRFQYDNATVKVDWALSEPVPWLAPDARRAAVLHIAESMNFLSRSTSELEEGLIPARPFLVFGQYSMVDESRSPAGTETAWAYTHVPQAARGDAGGELTGSWDGTELELFARRMEREVEEFAPGFNDLIIDRNIYGPRELERLNRNLVNGAINGGTAKLHQQTVFRPTPGLGRPETPVRGLYLASASAHPGGGVHGAPGAIAARALMRRLRPTSTLRRR